MIRQIAIGLALFLAPFAAYALYLWATQTRGEKGSSWTPLVLMWLTIAALLLVIASFAVWVQYSGAPPGANYVPAHMENGRFVPGAFK
jgi:H+/Cl- antiporter ClcA